jgi:hypothetical protein
MRVDDMTKNGWMTLLCFFASKTLRISFSGCGYGSSCPAANKLLYLNISPEIEARIQIHACNSASWAYRDSNQKAQPGHKLIKTQCLHITSAERMIVPFFGPNSTELSRNWYQQGF